MPEEPHPDALDSQRVVITGDHDLARGLADGLRRTNGTARVTILGGADAPCSFDSESAVQTGLHDAAEGLGGGPGVDQLIHAWYPPALLAGAKFVDLDEASWAGACERSLQVGWWTARHALDLLRPSQGSMVFVVPTLGMSGAAGYAMLATVAEALRGLAKGCGRQWGAHGVTVNTIAIAPHLLVGDDAGGELSRAVSLSNPALGGPGDPAQDLAPLIHLLAGKDAHFLTASTLVADGGLWMGL